MYLHEALYWQRAPGEWVNLDSYLQRRCVPGIMGGWDETSDPDPHAIGVNVCYDGPQRAVPGLFDLLLAAHPKARIAPPYRRVALLLRWRGPRLYDELTAALDDGLFVGIVTRVDAWAGGAWLTVEETAFMLARTHVDLATFQPVLAV